MIAISKRMRPLAPDQYHPADDPVQLLAARGEPGTRNAVQRFLDDLQKEADVAAILAALNSFDIYQLWEVIRLGDQFDVGMRAALDRLPEIHDAAGETINPQFNRLATDARTALTEYRDATIDEIADASQQAIKAVIQTGTTTGQPMEQIATTIRTIIGLTPKQALAVQNYRRALESTDLSALRRALRDERFDDAMRAAHDAKARMPMKMIDDMVAKYARRMRAYRAGVIAKSETLASANLGKKAGAIQAGADRRFWRTSMLENVCPLCMSIPILNPVGVPMDMPFASIGGPVNEPIEDTHPLCLCGIAYFANEVALPIPDQKAA